MVENLLIWVKAEYPIRRLRQRTAGGLNYWGALGRRHRLELSMVAPELGDINEQRQES